MKKTVVLLTIWCFSLQASAQVDEIQQLILNIEKLTQFKKILQNMYDGYKILSTGYTAVKNISEGNFNLHQNFLDSLLEVSPAVKKYKRIEDIISCQLRIVNGCKAALKAFKEDNQFTVEEIDYLGKVYSNLLHESIKNIDELVMVITAGRLRMSDDERLQAIDNIYSSILDQYTFLKEFNNNTAVLSLQRKSEQAMINMSRIIIGKK